MKKLVSLIMCVALCSAMLTGCGGYSGGKVKDGVYTNDVFRFKVTPDDDMIVMEDPMESTDAAVAFSYCYMQGGKDSFKAEYALNNLQGGMAIVSEENVGGYSTDDFVENIEAQLKEKVFWTYKTEVNEDVTIDGTNFRKLLIDSDGNHQLFFIKTSESRIIFIYIAVTKNGVKNGLEEQYVNAISGL
ncbi:MAG: hypothetical protein K5877_09260 [Lachnospiraceae bacterium]|nr:hypothetical protein [Lachnospiraceae bacterium]